MFPSMMEHTSAHAKFGASTLFVFLAGILTLGVVLAVEKIRNTGWGMPIILWHWVMLLCICWAVPERASEIWVEDEFPLAISVSGTDGLFRLHGSRLYSGQSWHCAVPLLHVEKFHSLCDSPHWLNKTMGSYYVQVRRSDCMENSYVGFHTEHMTTLVVCMLNQALHQWRELEATHT